MNVPRRRVLFSRDLLLLAGIQLSAVRFPVRGHVLIDALLLPFELGGFTGGQPPALHTVGGTVLLILLALGDGRFAFFWWRRRCRRGATGLGGGRLRTGGRLEEDWSSVRATPPTTRNAAGRTLNGIQLDFIFLSAICV